MINFANFKRFFLYSLIGSLIVSAIIAVIVVLVGTFNEVTGHVFSTLGMVVIHSLISLAFIWDDEKQNTFVRLSFFINVVFGIIAMSFITSILGIWKIIPVEIIPKLYFTYGIVAFASLHSDMLSKLLHKKSYMDNIIYANYFFISVVALMLLPVVYLDNAKIILGEMYYRILSAFAIVDGTLSVLTIILYRLYSHDHPEEQNVLSNITNPNQTTTRKGMSLWTWIFLVYLAFQIISAIIGFGMMAFYRK